MKKSIVYIIFLINYCLFFIAIKKYDVKSKKECVNSYELHGRGLNLMNNGSKTLYND